MVFNMLSGIPFPRNEKREDGRLSLQSFFKGQKEKRDLVEGREGAKWDRQRSRKVVS